MIVVGAEGIDLPYKVEKFTLRKMMEGKIKKTMKIIHLLRSDRIFLTDQEGVPIEVTYEEMENRNHVHCSLKLETYLLGCNMSRIRKATLVAVTEIFLTSGLMIGDMLKLMESQ